MVGEKPRPATTRRLADLQRELPGDATTRNLLSVLSAKLELSSRLPVFQWEAEAEGHDACAQTLRRLAEIERQSYADLLECLRRHIEATREAGG